MGCVGYTNRLKSNGLSPRQKPSNPSHETKKPCRQSANTKASPKHSRIKQTLPSQRLRKLKDRRQTASGHKQSMLIPRPKFLQSLRGNPKTPSKHRIVSKASRKNRDLLRMEIFGGTYMRLRYSPCQPLRPEAIKLELSLFGWLRLFLRFLFFNLEKKVNGFFCVLAFAGEQSQFTA
jgi:hypothetical protein